MLYLTINTNGQANRSNYEALREMVSEVEAFGEQDGWPSELNFRVNLVIDELVQNVLDYSRADGSGDVEVEVTSREVDLIIEITDDGIPFDPLTEAPEPDVTSAIEDRKIGGLGVHFTKTLMDDVEYRREDGKNRLKIVTRKVR